MRWVSRTSSKARSSGGRTWCGSGPFPATTRSSTGRSRSYLFKVGPVDLVDGSLLPDLVDFFAAGAADGKGVLELVGEDVAAFCDDLIQDSRTYADIYQESRDDTRS